MSSFFLKKKGTKRKAPGSKQDSKKKGRSASARVEHDEEILSDDSEVEGNPDAGYESEDDNETAEQKRLRLAKKYLEEIEREERERVDDSKIHDSVNQRLKDAELEESGKLRKLVADSYEPVDLQEVLILKDKFHKLAVTCLVVSPDSKFVVSASKDAGIVKWSLEDGKKLKKVRGGRKGQEAKHKGHCTTVNAMAISSDGKYLATGDNSKLIRIWNPETMEIIHTFKGHRDAISGLAFRRNTHTLYSCSLDRAVKIWSLEEMAYVETLFGHQDKITGIDSGLRERCVTSGGRDGSVRVWKIVEESQLVFNGPATSTDAVKLINEEHFLTGGEDGHISLWGVMKKRPLFTIKSAHGNDETNGVPNWIGSIAALVNCDIVASGSCDGYIRLWKCANNFRKLEEIQKIPVSGFVNSLAFTPDGNYLVAGVGQEHRLGRWWRIKEAKNSVVVIPLKKVEENE